MQIKLLKPCGENWQPHSYQKKAVRWLLEHGCAALFADPGLGKTACTLAAIKMLKSKGLLKKALIIAPVRVCFSVWPREIEKWADFHGLTCVVLHGPDKDRLLKKDVDIYLINPEGLDWLLKPTKTAGRKKNYTSVAVSAKDFRKLGFDTLVIDELSRFKHVQTQRFKAIKQVLGTFSRRWGLTGSPAANGLMDLFGQVFILDMGRSFTPYITHYRRKFFIPVEYASVGEDGEEKTFMRWDLQDGAEEKIYELLRPLALRISDSELSDMPTFIENKIMLELPPDVQELYDEMHEQLIIAIRDKVITAANAAVVSGKCRQIAAGGIYYSPELQENGLFKVGKRKWENLHTVKVEALESLVEELSGNPLLVAYEFEHDIDRLRKAFPKAVFVGDLKPREFDLMERRWNDGEIPLMFGHPQSIGHGLNLQGCGHHVAWHTPTWNFELYDQFNRRVQRQGNKSKRVYCHQLVMRGTVDVITYAALRRKDKTQRALFDALVSLAKKNKSK